MAWSCTNTRVSTQNISQVYKKDQTLIHPLFAVYHVTDDRSQLHFRLHSSEFLYTRPDGDTREYSCLIRISWMLKSSYEAKDVVDSGTVSVTDSYLESTDKDIVGMVDFKAKSPNNYLLQVTVLDVRRRQDNVSYIDINKTNNFNRQNFLVLTPGGLPEMKTFMRSNERFRLKNKTGADKYYVRYYKRDFPLPPPPFSIYNPKLFDYKADSTFTLQVNPGDTSGFCFPARGFYHLQTDTTTHDGLTIYRYDDVFPFVRSVDYLLSPLRYISSKSEYEKMNTAPNKKLAVDSFWVACAGSAERARELIKKFYNRVQDANNYFSSYVEGWRTDRGLIYTIYGPPNVLYRNSDTETWVYGEETNINSLTFSFVKATNPFTDNDYRIERNPSFKDSWYRAVDSWRQGRIMFDN
jgi:GWxTD domain-containing protein